MSAAYGGPPGCSADTPQQQQELIGRMCDRGYTANCGDDFDPDAPLTIGQTWTFNESPIQEQLYAPCGGDCYIPPGGHAPPTGHVGPTCDRGLVVMAEHLDSANGDDGCRPDRCDFGRRADGWCAPPTTSDDPMFYVLGSFTDENDNNMRLRVQMSHASTTDSTVTATTRDNTALAGSDYTPTSRQVMMRAGETL